MITLVSAHAYDDAFALYLLHGQQSATFYFIGQIVYIHISESKTPEKTLVITR